MQMAEPAIPMPYPGSGGTSQRAVMASVVQAMPVQTVLPMRKQYAGANAHVPVTNENLGPEFDKMTHEANVLAQAESALSTATSQLSTVLKKLPETEKKRMQAENEVHKLEKRIHGNESNTVFKWSVMQPQTWLSGGVPGKIDKLQAELQTWNDRVMAVSTAERELSEQKTQLQQRMPKLESNAATKASVSARAVQIFESAVHTFPSPALQTFEQNQQQWKSAVQFERVNSRSLMEVLGEMGQAREAYYNAMRALQGAMQMNRGAQFNNVMAGPGMGRRPGFEMMENMQEMQRNRMMQEAGHLAEMGGQMLMNAFSHIPQAARIRYPQLCVELGQVHVPSIDQMGLGATMMNLFGGELVDFAVNMQAKHKIHESMRRLSECEQIVARQEALCEALLAAIHRDGQAASVNLQNINNQVWAEKINVFNTLRVTNGLQPAATDAFTAAFAEANKATANLVAAEASYNMHHAAVQVQRKHRGRPVRRMDPMYDDGLW